MPRCASSVSASCSAACPVEYRLRFSLESIAFSIKQNMQQNRNFHRANAAPGAGYGKRDTIGGSGTNLTPHALPIYGPAVCPVARAQSPDLAIGPTPTRAPLIWGAQP